MKSPELHILERIEALRAELARPVVVALDGGSGSGKSTIAARLAKLTDIALVTLDDFYQTQVPESEWPHKTVAERLNRVFEWDRVREAIEPLRKGEPAQWRAFDFMQGLGPDGSNTPSDFGQRLVRVHANCLENLPLQAAVLLYAIAAGQTALTDPLAGLLLGARLFQSVMHLISTSPLFVWLRFAGFFIQLGILAYWLLLLGGLI